MYVAVVAIVLGHGLVLGSVLVLKYGLALWLVFHAFVPPARGADAPGPVRAVVRGVPPEREALVAANPAVGRLSAVRL